MVIPRAVGRFNKRVTNRVLRRLVGHGSFAEVEHVGRRSGRAYRTPVNAFLAGDRVVVGLTYGPDVDWLRNTRAADGCRIRLRDEVLLLGAPEVVPAESVLDVLPAGVRPVVRLGVVREAASFPVLSPRQDGAR